MTTQRVGITIRRAVDVRDALLNFLSEQGPRAPAEIYEPLADSFDLTHEERTQQVSFTDSRPGWNILVQTAREGLAKQGLLKREPKNLWSLTEAGEVSAAHRRAETKILTSPDFLLGGTEPFLDAAEGEAILRIHLVRERSKSLVEAFKASLSRPACMACGFDFFEVYGELGAGYIEAHHTLPVRDLKSYARTKLSDLVPLCANCHRVIHRSGLLGTEGIERLKQVLGGS